MIMREHHHVICILSFKVRRNTDDQGLFNIPMQSWSFNHSPSHHFCSYALLHLPHLRHHHLGRMWYSSSLMTKGTMRWIGWTGMTKDTSSPPLTHSQLRVSHWRATTMWVQSAPQAGQCSWLVGTPQDWARMPMWCTGTLRGLFRKMRNSYLR